MYLHSNENGPCRPRRAIGCLIAALAFVALAAGLAACTSSTGGDGTLRPGCLASANADCSSYPSGTNCPGPTICVACGLGLYTPSPSFCTCASGKWNCGTTAPGHQVQCPNPIGQYVDSACAALRRRRGGRRRDRLMAIARSSLAQNVVVSSWRCIDSLSGPRTPRRRAPTPPGYPRAWSRHCSAAVQGPGRASSKHEFFADLAELRDLGFRHRACADRWRRREPPSKPCFTRASRRVRTCEESG